MSDFTVAANNAVLDLVGIAVGWVVTLVERGKAGVPLAALWTLAAILLNLVMFARLSGGTIG